MNSFFGGFRANAMAFTTVGAFLLLLLLGGNTAQAQFNTANVNGTIAANEYGTHTDGQNQNTNSPFATLMTWDNTNLYVAISGTGNNTGEAIVLYLDKDNLTPIDGGTNASGTNVGNAYDNTNFAQLPYRADLVVYLKDGYNEYRTANGSNGWNSATSGALGYSSSGVVQELSIPWSLIGGRPTSFNFFSYKTSSGGFVYAQQPTLNAGGSIGASARYSYYYTVTSTADQASTKPFSRMSYVFNSTSSVAGFGAISVWDFTMNSGGGGTSITRANSAGGVWTISGNLVLASGTIDFGSSTSTANIGNLAMSGGTLTLSTAGGGDLNLTGNFTKTAGTFNCNSRAVGFNGTTKQLYSSTATENINFLTISNTTDSVVLTSSVNIPAPSSSSTTLSSSNNAKLGIRPAATLTVNSSGAAVGNINFGGSGTRVKVEGKLTNAGTSTANTYTNVTATTLIFENGGTYEHNFTTVAGTIPTATWNTGSTCSIIGYTTVSAGQTLTGLGQSFHHFTWNTPNWTTSSGRIEFAGALTTVNGNLTFQNTNSKEIRFSTLASYTLNVGGDFLINTSTNLLTLHYSNGGGTFAAVINVTGNLTQVDGTLRLAHTSNVNVNYPSTTTINVAQNVSLAGTVVLSTSNGAGTINQNGAAPTYGFSQTAGSIDFGQGTLSSSPGVGAINVKGTFSRTATGSLTTSGSAAPNGKITFNGGISQTLTSTTSGAASYVDYQVNNASTVTLQSNLVLNSASTTSVFTVLNGGTLVCGTNIISGAATTSTFALNSGATIKVGSTSANGALATGAFGNIQTTTRTLNAGATYEYNGTGTQFTGAALPASLTGNLKINNTNGVSLTQNTAFTGAGTLTLTSGKFTTNAKTLTLISSTAGSTSSYIVTDATGGTVTMNAVNTAKTLPIGTSSSYAPLIITAGSSTNYTTYVTTSLPCAVTDNTKIVNLAWNINGSTTPSSVVFQWNSGDQAASFNPGAAVELGRSTCPSYSTTALSTPGGSDPYTITAGTGFATGAQNYVIGNLNAVYLAVTPSLSTPTAVATSSTSATLGATIVSDNGSAITARGTSYKTTSPVVATDNQLAEGGTAVAAFSHSRTGLAPQTQYFYVGYATNGNGTNISSEGNFRTYSNPPTAPAGGFTATTASPSQINLSWTTATYPGTGATKAGYLVVYSTGTPSLIGSPNGVAPASAISVGNQASVTETTLPASPALSVNVTGLTAQTTYNFIIVPYTWDGTNAATYSYYTTSVPSASRITFSNAPTAQPAGIAGTATGAGSFSVTLNGNATYPGSGATKAGYLLLYGTTAPSLVGSPNGLTQASAISSGTPISVSETNLPGTPTVTGLTASGLTANTIYYLLIVPYTWDGTNATTYSYFTTGANTSTVTTLPNGYYWNGGTNTANPANGGTGNWSDANNWRIDYNGAQTNWADGNPAILGGTAGTVTLSATVAPSSTTFLSSGYTLATSGASALSLTGDVSLGTNGINVSPIGGADLTLSGIISGASALTKISAGTLFLNNGGNTYSGGTTINAGILSIDGPNRLGASAGAVTINNATLQVTSGISSARNFTIGNAASTIDITSSSYTAATASLFSGTGRINKTGAGSLIFPSANATSHTYSGGVTITGGSVQINKERDLGALPGSATPGNIILDGGTLASNATITIGTNRGIAVGPSTGSGSGTIDVASGTTLTYGGILANNGGTGSLVKTNTGTLTLSGSNTYSGGTQINGGILSIGADARLGTAPGSPIANSIGLNGGTLAASAGFTLFGNRGIGLGTGNGTIDVASATTLVYGGIIADNGSTGALSKTSAGTLTLSGANTYTGTTTISAGTVNLTGSLSSSSAVTVASGATLSGTGTAAGTVNNSGTLSPAGSPSIGTLGTGSETWNTSSTYVVDLNNVTGSAGTINDLLAITGSLTTSGAVNVTLAGTITGFSLASAASWTIATTTTGITNGATYTISTTGITNSIGSGTFSISVSGNNLILNYTPGQAIITFSTTAGSATGLVGSSNNVIYRAILAVTGNNATITGVTYTTAGTYAAADIATDGFKLWYSTNSAFSTGTATQIGSSITSTGTGETLPFTTGISQALTAGTTYYLYVTVDYTVGATIGNTINIASTATTNYTFSGTVTRSGTSGVGTVQTISGYSIRNFNTSSSSAPWLTTGNWTPSGVPTSTEIAQFNGTMPSNFVGINMNTAGGLQQVGAISFTNTNIAGNIQNSSSSAAGELRLNGVVLNGNSNLVLSNTTTSVTNQTFSAINTLTIGLGNTTNIISTSAGTNSAIGNGFIINAPITQVTSPSSITFLGGGTWNGTTGNNGGLLRLGGANTFTGGVTIGKSDGTQNGILQLDVTGAMGNIAGNNITINPNSQLFLNATGIYTTGNITLNLNGNGNNVTTTYGAGALRVNGTSASYNWTGPVNLASNSSISADNSASTLTLSGVVSGSNQLTKVGAGTLALTGANTYTGTTTVSAGILQLNKTGGTTIPATNNVTINGGNLKVTTNQAINNLTLTSGTLTVDAGITLTINGSYTGGGTIINNGKIVLAGPSAFPGSATIVTTMTDLEINRSGGVTLDKSFTVSGTLALTNGSLDLNGFTLTISSNAAQSITGSAGNTFNITGSAGSTLALSSGGTSHVITLSNFGTAASANLTTGINVNVQLNANTQLDCAGNGTTTSMLTVLGTFTMNSATASNIANVHPPFYGEASTLIYNANYGRFSEWNATSGPGYPNNVTVTGSTTLDVVNSVNTYKKAAGTLTVNTGSTFSVPALTAGNGSGVGVEFLGDIVNDGTISLNTGANTTSQRLKGVNLVNGNAVNLSGTPGGDLELTGNYTDNAVFNANTRAVFFTGTGTQTIGGTATAPFNIDYIVVTKASGSVQLLTNLLTEGPNGGNAMTLTSSMDIFDLNGHTFTIGKTGVTSTLPGSGLFKGSSTSNMVINGIGAFGTIRFDQTTPGTTNALQNLTINRTGTGSVTMGSALDVLGAAAFTAGVLDVNGNTLGLAGTVSTGGGTITEASGTTVFNGSSAQNIPSGIFTSNAASNITIANSAGVTFNGSVAVSGNFQVNANSIFTPVSSAIISGAGTLSGISNSTSTAQVTKATGTTDFTGQYTIANKTLTNLNVAFIGVAAQGAAANTFGGLTINNTGGVTMAGDITVDAGLNLSIGNLVIGTNTLTLNGGVSRTGGNLAGSNASNLTIGGTAGSLFFDQTGNNNYLKDITLNSSATATLGNSLNITAGTSANTEGAVTVSGTGSLLTTGDFLTLKSNSFGTARVAEGRSAGGYITGNVTAERFIGSPMAKRAYRLLTAPLRGASANSIFATWQDNGGSTIGVGTRITAPSGPTSGGIDDYSPGYSLQKVNIASGTLEGVTETKTTNFLFTNPAAGTAGNNSYFLFVRGDRLTSIDGTANTTLRPTGTLQTGNQSFAINPAAGKLTLIGNPYASPVDFDELYADNSGSIKRNYYFWDPNKGGSTSVGGYINVSHNGNTYDYVGGSTTNTEGYTQNIQSGQAVFMVTEDNPASTSITFSESNKSVVTKSNVFRDGAQIEKMAISLGVIASGVTNLDGTLARYSNLYTAGVGNYDIPKLNSPSEDLSVERDGVNLSVESRPLIDDKDTLFIRLEGMGTKNYQFTFTPTNFDAPGLTAFLEDRYLQTSTPVSLSDETTIQFSVVASDAASKAANRFRLVYRLNSVLPLSFTHVKAFEKSNDIQVEWNLGNEGGISRYEVEKSIDGRTFTKAGTQPVRAIANANESYSWLDVTPNSGDNFYRIKAIERSGEFKYSQVVNVKLGKGKSAISVYPNPVSGNAMNLQFVNQPKGKYAIQLFNNLGQQVYRSEINHSGGSSTETIHLNNKVVKGIYQLQVTNGEAKVTQKVIVQ